MLKIVLTFIMISVTLFGSITINGGEYFRLEKDENITINGSLHIKQNAHFVADTNATINISKDWINEGEFLSSTSTVTFISDANTTVEGNTTFYNFSAAKNLYFEAGQTQTITNSLSLTAGKIWSTVDGTQATLDLSTVSNINTQNLEIKDSKIVGRLSALNPPNSVDYGNNTKWFSKNNNCQNSGSGHNWFDRLTCENNQLEYLISDNKIMFNGTDDVSISVDESPSKKLTFYYKTSSDAGKLCTNDAKVVAGDAGGIETLYESCQHKYYTINNWEKFKNNIKVNILDTSDNNSSSIIAVDVKVSDKIIIGGSYDK